MTLHTIGVSYWLPSGEKVEYCGTVQETGMFVVRPIRVAEDFEDGEWVEFETTGEPKLSQILLYNEPKDVRCAAYNKAKEELPEVLQQLNDMRAQLDYAEKKKEEAERRLRELSYYPGLELLESFVAGRVTHLVTNKHDSLEVETFSEALENNNLHNQGLRLVTLFGKPNGDLTWRRNSYRHGSGGWDEIRPAMGEEDAQKVARRWAVELRDEFYEKLTDPSSIKRPQGAHEKPHHLESMFSAWCEQAERYGADTPQEIAELRDKTKTMVHGDRVEAAEEKVREAEKDLAKLQAAADLAHFSSPLEALKALAELRGVSDRDPKEPGDEQ